VIVPDDNHRPTLVDASQDWIGTVGLVDLPVVGQARRRIERILGISQWNCTFEVVELDVPVRVGILERRIAGGFVDVVPEVDHEIDLVVEVGEQLQIGVVVPADVVLTIRHGEADGNIHIR